MLKQLRRYAMTGTPEQHPMSYMPGDTQDHFTESLVRSRGLIGDPRGAYPWEIEYALRYLETYLESKDPAAIQRELDLLATTEYQEASMLIEHFTKLGIEKGKAEGKAEGLEEGLRLARLDDARKMLARGYDWSDITEITGIRPEDLG